MSSQAQAIRRDAAQRRLGAREAATAVGNEITKGLLHAWGERLQILIELPLFVAFFLLITLILGRGQQIAGGHLDWRFDPAQVSSLIVGYAAYGFWYLQTAKLFWRLLGEIQSGTLEQVYLSPLPAWLVAAAGRVLATVVETAFVIAALTAVVYAVVPFHIFWRVQALVPISLILIASVGYSLMEGGFTLIWKRVELFHELALGLMAFLSGALIPLDRLPNWMAEIGRFAPIGQGVVGLRVLLVHGGAALPSMRRWKSAMDGGDRRHVAIDRDRCFQSRRVIRSSPRVTRSVLNTSGLQFPARCAGRAFGPVRLPLPHPVTGDFTTRAPMAACPDRTPAGWSPDLAGRLHGYSTRTPEP